MNKDTAAKPSGLTPVGKLCRLIAWLALLVLVVGTALAYPFLPELVPQNFHADGSFRGESPRWSIWTVPVFAVLLHWLMSWARKRPVQANNIVHIDDNTPAWVKDRIQQYNHSLIWFMVAVINAYFAWAQSIYIGAATGWWPKMPAFSLWMLLLLGAGFIYYLTKILKVSQQKTS